MPAPRWERSEGVLGADLCAAWVAHHTARFADVGGAKPRVVTAKVLVVEDVEQIYRHPQARAIDLREVLPEPEVDPAVRPAAGDQVVVHGGGEPTVDVRTRPAKAGWATDVEARATPQREQSAELNPEQIRHVHDPVCHDVLPLVIPAVVGVLRDADRVRIRTGERPGEVAEVVGAGNGTLGVCVHDPGTP